MATLNFGGINVTVNTATQEMLFSWMLFHKDAIKFKLDGKVFELLEHSAEKAVVKVDDQIVTIDHPYDWKFKDYASDTDLDYNHSGDYTWIDRKGYIYCGTDLDGDISFSCKVNNDWSLSECHYGNRIYPEVQDLGFDEDHLRHYVLKFNDYDPIRFLYCYEDPVHSYIEY